MVQVAMACVLKNAVVDAPIVGAAKPRQVADAVASLDLRVTAHEISALETPDVLRLPTFF